MRKLISGISLAIAVVFLTATVASAHTDLQKSNPSDGQSINVPIDRIELTFTEPPLIDGSKISLADSTGAAITTEETQLDGSTLYVPWPTDIQPGEITVNWRIAADDGHVVDGSFTFTYTAAATSGVGVSATPNPDAGVTDQPTVIATPLTLASPIALPTNADDDGDDESKERFLPILLGLAVLGAGAWALTRRKSDN